MDKDEALKLALEALQWNWGGEPLPTLELKAINAIKEALAQPEFVLNGIDCSCGKKWRVVNNTLTASEQPEQEPEAWQVKYPLAQPKQEPEAWQVKYLNDEGIPQIAWFSHPVHPKSPLAKRPYTEEPLYTAPPQREWVGLTEEEYKNIRYGSDESGPYVSYGEYDEGYECGSEIEIYVDDFAKAIEAKLREKNGG